MHCQSLLPGWLPCLAFMSQLQSSRTPGHKENLLTASVPARLAFGSVGDEEAELECSRGKGEGLGECVFV